MVGLHYFCLTTRTRRYFNSGHSLSDQDFTELIGNQLNLEDMNVMKLIGKGYGTIVQFVQHKQTGHFFALKIIEMDIEESVHRQIEEKLRLIQSSQCPHVDYYQYFYNNGAISIMFEYMDGGSLAELLKKVKSIPEPYLAAICKQALKGLISLHHKAKVIHPDIKPSKLLINHGGEVKITDFGENTSLLSSSGRANTFVGTYSYMSPERIVVGSYDTDADIWSFSVIGSLINYSLQKDPKKRKSGHELLVCKYISIDLWPDPNELPFVKMYDSEEVELSSYFSSALATP
ncbi:mitogen-activated protein kinase kinase 2 [Gossypium australe]|uniref:mitogen-activated protein kinase kinase n=1 Tax=Gossypium australe TaxID=47621 RepID=A0A5B6W7K8_9ROSI|nr:mitogen-activated protein kinase kinase 2 [Gossypium australe]